MGLKTHTEWRGNRSRSNDRTDVDDTRPGMEEETEGEESEVEVYRYSVNKQSGSRALTHAQVRGAA